MVPVVKRSSRNSITGNRYRERRSGDRGARPLNIISTRDAPLWAKRAHFLEKRNDANDDDGDASGAGDASDGDDDGGGASGCCQNLVWR
jgi:hypothetical protein